MIATASMRHRLLNGLAAGAFACACSAATPAFAAPCSGFNDVDAASAFCANVEWIANRGITQGCAQSLYCPGDAVTRLAMAAFMNRLGSALTPAVVRGESRVAFVFGQGIVCATADVAQRAFPGTATVHGRFTGNVTGSANWAESAIVASFDQGATWVNASPAGGPSGPFRSDVPSSLSDTVVLDVPAGQPVRFALRVATDIAQSAYGTCSVIASVGNRNGATTPP
jgi:hypothetical protein